MFYLVVRYYCRKKKNINKINFKIEHLYLNVVVILNLL